MFIVRKISCHHEVSKAEYLFKLVILADKESDIPRQKLRGMTSACRQNKLIIIQSLTTSNPLSIIIISSNPKFDGAAYMSQTTKLKILIIDDNPAVHQDFMKILVRNKDPSEELDSEMNLIANDLFAHHTSTATILPEFEIDTASQGKEGVDKIAAAVKNGSPYALAFVDIRMPPGWDGIETIKHIWMLDKNIQIVICTAYSDYSWEQTVAHLGQTDNLLILKKPFDHITARQLACALTKKWQLMEETRDHLISLEERVKERTASLNESLSCMHAALESSADGILVIDSNGKIVNYNSKLMEMWKFKKHFMTSDFNTLQKLMYGPLIQPNDLSATIKKLKHKVDDIVIGVFKFQDNRTIEYYSQPYTLDDKVQGRVWSFRDITQHAQLEEALQFQASHDTLTGLPNRILLHDHIKESIRKATHDKSLLGILFLDLDRFKLINDSLNHEAGDKLLRIIAKRIASAIENEDIVVRLGGDEFIILKYGVKNKEELAEFARKILTIIEETMTIQHKQLVITASIGISIYPKDGKNADELIRNADYAMYSSKESGGNQFQFYSENLNQKTLNRLEHETELRHATANNEFELYYQPQFDVNTGKIVSFEALIRWNHPKKGCLLPLDFIPLAEDSDLIVPIGEWAIRTACRQLKTWQDMGLPRIRVAVNVASKQFKNSDLVNSIKNILEETKLAAEYLELELTENMIINNDRIINMIADLKKIGVKIALDDFGTGNSSLNYLRKIKVDRIKIDQSFVQNIGSERGDTIIIQAIIALANSLNLEVVAEGVETKKQLRFLQKLSCKELQGYYFSKPIPASRCEKMLKESDKFKVTE